MAGVTLKKPKKSYKILSTPIKNNNFTIIGGEYRSRKFSFPDVDTLRPSPNKVRETLFNFLASLPLRNICVTNDHGHIPFVITIPPFLNRELPPFFFFKRGV
jgi:hypothetical protein